ncbi:MAG TPA: DUF1080 domain-containing protein [Longimicrobiaceae bacterium]
MRTRNLSLKKVHTAPVVGLVLTGLLVAGCSSADSEGAPAEGAATEGTATQGAAQAGAPNALTAQEQAEGWVLLFDGDDLDQWRGYRRDTPPARWQPQDSVLAFVPEGDDGGDLMTREQFGDFEFRYDWRISEGGNSGVIYRATEDSDAPWHTGPEMQILDDERHPDANAGVNGNRRAGSLYDMIAPTPGVVRPAGQWNEARIVANGNHVEHWLNGQKVVEYEIGSERWDSLYQASKFTEYPGFGVQQRGYIVLQDHGDPVWFRNLKIRPLGS